MWRQLQMKDGKVTQPRREELERSHHLKKWVPGMRPPSVLCPEGRIKCLDNFLWLRIAGCGSPEAVPLDRVGDLKGLG